MEKLSELLGLLHSKVILWYLFNKEIHLVIFISLEPYFYYIFKVLVLYCLQVQKYNEEIINLLFIWKPSQCVHYWRVTMSLALLVYNKRITLINDCYNEIKIENKIMWNIIWIILEGAVHQAKILGFQFKEVSFWNKLECQMIRG